MHYHLIGIAGTAMGSLAGLLREKGHRVTGSDEGVYPPMSTLLDSLGIEYAHSFDPANLEPEPDVVVVGNAISRGNPELEAVLERRLYFASAAHTIKEEFLRKRHVVAVAGTHGKTTTTAILSWLLESAGLEPSFLIGGVAENFGRSFRLTDSELFIIEADEYDTAYFDKGPKMWHYLPWTAVVTNVEFDHADIYRDEVAYRFAFERFVNLVPRTGTLVAGWETPMAREVSGKSLAPVESFGVEGDDFGEGAVAGDAGRGTAAGRHSAEGKAEGPVRRDAGRATGSAPTGGGGAAGTGVPGAGEAAGADVPGGGKGAGAGAPGAARSGGEDRPEESAGEGAPAQHPRWRAVDVRYGRDGTSFRVLHDGREMADVRTTLSGAYNVRNCLAAVAAARAVGASWEGIVEGLATFLSVRRRMEVRGEVDGVTVVDDFAHHPTAVRETVEAARQRWGDGRVVAIFEPRSYTAQRREFQEPYRHALGGADRVVLAGLFHPERYDETTGMSPVELVASLRHDGVEADYIPEVDRIVSTVVPDARRGDVLLVMSNGGFAGIHDKLLTALQGREALTALQAREADGAPNAGADGAPSRGG